MLHVEAGGHGQIEDVLDPLLGRERAQRLLRDGYGFGELGDQEGHVVHRLELRQRGEPGLQMRSAVQQDQTGHLPPQRSELTGHLIGDHAAQRVAAQVVRALRLHPDDVLDVGGGHLLDAVVRFPLQIE
ncbi:hypothetical protein EH183_30450 [Streptomyces sp. CB01881]|nr:hypothetical protein EH183_30450 [Streptomyces sp. CB01881]